ncbi:MAG: site-specific integrase [Anaerolineae bacterium]|nr:site-specific integrase [Anaerolineae bacterium]
MPAQARITLAVVARLKPGDTVWDTEVKGFGARYRATAVSYFVKKRINGKQSWITIGKHGSPWTPETARKKALTLAADAAAGVNPAEIRRAERAKITFAEAAEEFLAQHGKKIKPTTLSEYDRLIRTRLLPAFGTLKVEAITHTIVAKAHTSWSEKPRTANLCLAVMSKLMSWCEDHDHIAANSNPCRRIKKYAERSRERYLTNSEIEKLLAVLDDLDARQAESPYATAAIRLLLLTGARLSEITTLKWKYVDLETATLWLPDSKTGKKAIRLNPQAVAVLTTLPRMHDNPFVIVGHRDGAPIINLHKPWWRIRALAGLDDMRIHDLRHSFASIAINAGASLAMVGKLLGHTQQQTTARYAHLADDPLRQLNNQIGAAIAGKPKEHTS